jgi:16S rRNA processing protein RimM
LKEDNKQGLSQQQGSAERSEDQIPEPAFLVIGQMLRPHGVRGEMRTAIHTGLPERFTWLDEVYVGYDPEDENPQPYTVENVRFHQGHVLVKLRGFDGRDEIDELRGKWLMVPVAEAVPLEEDEVFFYQLEGLEVYTDAGEYLGKLTEVMETGANEVFVVQGPRGEILLPNTEEVVQQVDLEAGQVVITPLPGLY